VYPVEHAAFGVMVHAGIFFVPVDLPLLSWMCCKVSVSWLVRQVEWTQEMIWTDPPPSSVILLPPSMTTWTGVLPVEIGGLSVDVTEMVRGLGPQLNVMIPPPLTALDSAWNVQLAGVPLPTTVVGWLVSTACASAGNVSVVQEPLGLPATGNVPASLDAPLEEPAPLEPVPELPPLLDPDPLDPVPLDPVPLDPVPLDPVPLDPVPLDPAPLDPAPLDPASLDPASLDPASLDPASLDPASLDPAPLDPAPLDAAPLDPAPLDPPVIVLAPSRLEPPPSSPPEPLPELDPGDEPPSPWPEALFPREPVLLLHPIPTATETDNETNARAARISILLRRRSLLDATGHRRRVPRRVRSYIGILPLLEGDDRSVLGR
jgi:hypothetical protein